MEGKWKPNMTAEESAAFFRSLPLEEQAARLAVLVEINTISVMAAVILGGTKAKTP